MGLLFENPNAKSLSKKWCATSMLPIPTPLQVLRLKLKSICKNRTNGSSQNHRHDPTIRKEESIG